MEMLLESNSDNSRGPTKFRFRACSNGNATLVKKETRIMDNPPPDKHKWNAVKLLFQFSS